MLLHYTYHPPYTIVLIYNLATTQKPTYDNHRSV